MDRKLFNAGGKTVVWLWDSSEHNAANFPSDNLSITSPDGEQLWNMRDTLGHEDCCVSVRTQGDNITFITFKGISVTFNVREMTLVSRTITK